MVNLKKLLLPALAVGAFFAEGCCVTPRRPDAKFFTCQALVDYDRNGEICYPNEYVGIKNDFCQDESLTIVSHDEGNLERYESKIEIYVPNGRCFASNPKITSSNHYYAIPYNSASELSNVGGFGQYCIEWKVDGKTEATNCFRINNCAPVGKKKRGK